MLVVAPAFLGAQAADSSALKADIRRNYQEINDLAQRGQLTVKQRKCPGVAPEFSLMTDRAGVIRRYVLTTGTDDSALSFQHDYDRAGRLTFVLVTYGSVHGQTYEWRLYFSPSGRVFDLIRTAGMAPFNEALLWKYVTSAPAIDWKSNWCP
ncbi:hypothetical protein Dxin01_03385 [Deinococcus xinjiangensis]|uniref:Uncharacterized protein n=2 Tax=Deinococcus xinjiangensis TaxID=457454 RepID=A0ABP9VEF8_9DEIO